jgi:hypothetical protein
MAYAHIPDCQRTKLDKKAEKMRFVGYSIQSKGYRLLDDKTGNVLVRRDVVFNESDFGQPHPEARKESLVVEMDGPIVQEQHVTPDLRPQEAHEYPDRLRQAPVRYGIDEYVSIVTSDDQLSDNYPIEPNTLKEALSSDNSREWKAAADAEYQSLVENETWELVELPAGRTAIGCKWAFKAGCGCDGSVDRCRGRHVAGGCDQRCGVDCDETCSPVVLFEHCLLLLWGVILWFTRWMW